MLFFLCQEFIKRNGQFTVNVGLCEEGVPVLGVVGVPAAAEPRTYFAVKSEGAFVEVCVCVHVQSRCVVLCVVEGINCKYVQDSIRSMID